MNDERKLRKYEHALVISGAGTILFGAWSVVKAVAFSIMSPLTILASVIPGDDLDALHDVGLSNTAVSVVALVMILLVLLIGLALRYYIGRAAIQDGRRIRRRRPVYIVFAVILSMTLVSSIFWNYIEASPDETATKTLDAMSVSVIVDITSFLCLLEMIVSAIFVRKLRKRLGVQIGPGGSADLTADAQIIAELGDDVKEAV